MASAPTHDGQALSTSTKMTTLRLGPIPAANRVDDDLGCAGWGLSPVTTTVARVTRQSHEKLMGHSTLNVCVFVCVSACMHA